jgi:hypothetical protein
VTELAIYAEGGGDTTHQKAELRVGLDGLLNNVKSKAREKRLGWKLVCAGGRQATYEAFINALHTNPGTINVLLVDSETSIVAATDDTDQDAAVRVAHLTQCDQWDLSEAHPKRVHLMVQCMETWIVADMAALRRFYGQGFAPNSLPRRVNLEEEPKVDVYEKLVRATRATQKGEYSKIQHASQLLQNIDPTQVAARCPRFAILTRWLGETIVAA